MKYLKIIKYYLSIILLLLSNIKKISYSNNLFTIQFRDNSSFVIRNFMDLWVLTETYLNRDYEKYGSIIENNWTILDIGAAFGDFSILSAKKSSSNKIIAVEPLPSSLKLFKENIKNNHLKNIKIYSGALSSTQEKINLIENTNNYNHSETTTSSSLSIPSISLSKLFKNYHISHCNLLKCDCEGAEYDIFSKLSPTTYQRIDRIIMEYHLFNSDSEQKLKQLISSFKRNSFKIKISPNPVHSTIGFLYAFKKN